MITITLPRVVAEELRRLALDHGLAEGRDPARANRLADAYAELDKALRSD